MQQIILFTQIGVSIALIIVILMQQQGSGLGGAFGGGGGLYSTRRGSEKFLFWASIILATIFILLALINIFI
ncbi:preprotein translocase subunit SecG [Patescibacteria group bacterium]